MKYLFLLFGFLFLQLPIYAADVCQYFLSIPVDNGSCGNSGINTVTGGGFPTFSDAFNLNPASIPILKTPVGVEGTYSYNNKDPNQSSESNVALIKGYDGFGFGMTSNSDRTFLQIASIKLFRQPIRLMSKKDIKIFWTQAQALT